MTRCACTTVHEPKRVVLTGGPGAGKTAILELIRQSFCRHVRVLPESAGIVFGGGFPRGSAKALRDPAQRAIFYVQRELEAAAAAEPAAIVLCDRGTVDGVAYWEGPDDFWASVGTTLPDQLARYHTVIQLRTPSADGGYDRSNPLRIETPEEAHEIDERIADAWSQHPHRFVVPSTASFMTKAQTALDLLRREMPECCRIHVVPALEEAP